MSDRYGIRIRLVSAEAARLARAGHRHYCAYLIASRGARCCCGKERCR